MNNCRWVPPFQIYGERAGQVSPREIQGRDKEEIDSDRDTEEEEEDCDHLIYDYMMMGSPPTRRTTSPSTLSSSSSSSSSACFHCKKQGHWVKDCPLKSKAKMAPAELYTNSTTTTPATPCVPPNIECDINGHGPCTAKVSRSASNPSRIYYACSLLLPNGSKCRFFKWYDQLNMTNTNAAATHTQTGGAMPSLSPSDYPMCSCGAGHSSLMLETSPPNAGRFYFVCPITKGHGACPFFLWYDDHLHQSRHDASLKSPLNGHQAVNTLNYDLDEYDELSSDFEHPNGIKFESAEFGNPPPFPTFDFKPFGALEIKEEPLIGREEHEHDDDTLHLETPTKSSNLQVVLRQHFHDQDVQEGNLLDPIMEKAPQVFQQTSKQAEIHHQQIELWRQSSAVGDTLTGVGGKDHTHQMLGFQIFGWLGRLAFSPSGRLILPPSKPFYGGVFQSLDIVFIPKKTYESRSEGLIDLPHSPSLSDFHSSPRLPSEDDAQPSSGVLFELSGIKNHLGPLQDSVATGTIVEALEQAALPIQNLLLNLLESMDPLKRESMTRVVDCTFAALDHLSVNYSHFSKHVRKLIDCASSLAEIERSIHNDLSSQQLIKWYHDEIDRFDNISRTHADVVDAFTTSDHRLQSLGKEAARVKEMLLKIERQVSDCEAETLELKSRVGETSKDMIESKRRLEAAAQKAEVAMQICHQREVNRNAAKAAFEEARGKLR